jgi:hypothetical protein
LGYCGQKNFHARRHPIVTHARLTHYSTTITTTMAENCKFNTTNQNVMTNRHSQLHQTTPNDWANRAAFYGDKVLNYYISQIIRQNQPKSTVLFQEDAEIGNQLTRSGIDLGFVTLVQGEAMSNQLYSNLFATIMGAHPDITSDMIRLAQTQVHDVGTMIEATVDAILNRPPLDTAMTKTTTTKPTRLPNVHQRGSLGSRTGISDILGAQRLRDDDVL